IRFFNGVFDINSVDVKITNSLGTAQLSNLSYKTFTNYLELQPGINEIVVNVAGTQTTILTSEANLESGMVYTAFFLGAQGLSGGKEYNLCFMKENNTNSQFLSTFPTLKSNLRFINGSIDNPLLDLLVDDNVVANSISYKLATSILKVNSGSNRSFKLRLFGSTTPILSKEYNLTYNKNYTFLVTNKSTSLDAIFFENPTKTAPSGKTSLRLIHGAYDVGNVDLTINTNGVKTKITNLSYKNVSNYVDISAGYSEIILTNSGSGSIIYSAADATLEANKVYSIYFLGDKSGRGGTEYSLNFLNETESSGQYLFTYSSINFTKLRMINACPNGGGLDLYIDDNKVTSNLNFTQTLGYQYIRSGERNIKIYPAGKTTPTLLNFNYELEQNKNYSLIVMDSLVKLTPILLEDLTYTPITGKAFVRFINASSDAPPFDIKIGSPSGVVKHSYFSYQQITEYEQYDPAVLSFIFTQANTNTELLSLRGFSMVANRAYTIIIMGFVNGVAGQTLTVRWYLDN
ncbi:MAG: DUF4397 domain-containing protein, partial [Ignavibacteria bacterium]|nr:DUF4397 domain-containing protein [Ignavibacteria bacterium]